MMKRIFIKSRQAHRGVLVMFDRYPKITASAVVLLASAIFMLRNITAFTMPNFYAEDATVFYQNIFSANFFEVLTTTFNGYLVIGQYIVAYIAAGLSVGLGGDLETLAIMTAVISCIFLGFVASLPLLLFRKELGLPLALLTVLLTVLVPLSSFDYAIIGTLGNLKFAFLYVAFLLVVYRFINLSASRNKLIIVDSLLFLCVLTNVTVAFLLPIILLPYVPSLWKKIRRKESFHLEFGLLSGVTIVVLSALYTLFAVVKGIPKIPGYLEGPFKLDAILPMFDRSTYYALTYPITESLNKSFVIALVLVTLVTAMVLIWRRNRTSYVVLTAGWAIFLGTALFAVNRPGIGDFFLTFHHKGGPDQFFYAQNMIFIFLLAWLVSGFARKLSYKTIIGHTVLIVLYLLLAIPKGTSFGGSAVVYQSMQPIQPNLQKACRVYSNQEDVIIQIYPTNYWQWKVDRKLACSR